MDLTTTPQQLLDTELSIRKKELIDPCTCTVIHDNATDALNRTPFHIALVHNNVEAIKCFYNRGAKGLDISTSHWHFIFNAEFHFTTEVLWLVLTHIDDFEVTSNNMASLLHLVARTNDASLVEYCVSKGLDVNAQCVGGNTPLHVAASVGAIDVVKSLISHHADVNLRNHTYHTPLLLSHSMDILRLLYEAKAQLMPACTLVTQFALLSQLVRNHCTDRDIIFLFDNKYSLGESDRMRLLFVALEAGNVSVSRYLLNTSANRQLLTTHRSPLLETARSGNIEAVQLVLDLVHLDVNEFGPPNSFIKTRPAFAAAEGGNIELLRFLISIGASTERSDQYPVDLLSSGAKSGSLDMILYISETYPEHSLSIHDNAAKCVSNLLRSKRSDKSHALQYVVEKYYQDHIDLSLINAAVRDNDVDLVELLIRLNADVTAYPKPDRNPLFIASKRGDMRMMECLLRHGAIVDTDEKFSSLLLHDAVASSYIIFRALLTRLYSAPDSLTESVLYEACVQGNADVVRWMMSLPRFESTSRVQLLQLALESHKCTHLVVHAILQDMHADANLMIHDEPLLIYAVKDLTTHAPPVGDRKPADIVRYLLQSGAQVNCRSSDGLTPLHYLSTHPPLINIMRSAVKLGARTNFDGMSPPLFKYMLEDGVMHPDVVQLLMNNGVDFESPISVFNMGEMSLLHSLFADYSHFGVSPIANPDQLCKIILETARSRFLSRE